jgi:hypothetical protein
MSPFERCCVGVALFAVIHVEMHRDVATGAAASPTDVYTPLLTILHLLLPFVWSGSDDSKGDSLLSIFIFIDYDTPMQVHIK